MPESLLRDRINSMGSALKSKTWCRLMAGVCVSDLGALCSDCSALLQTGCPAKVILWQLFEWTASLAWKPDCLNFSRMGSPFWGGVKMANPD